MITLIKAASILKKITDVTPTLYEEYKDKYRFVFVPDNCGTDLLSWSTNIDVYKRTGKVKPPDFCNILSDKSKPIKTGIFVK